MRYLILFFSLLLLTVRGSAQNRYNPEDFHKLKRLAAPWLIQANAGMPIYEKWEITNDSLLSGTWYRITSDKEYVPEAGIKLCYHNHRIFAEFDCKGDNNGREALLTFELKSTDKGIYSFASATDALPAATGKRGNIKSLINITYDFSKKGQVTVQRQYIIPDTGLQTVRYVFIKDGATK